MKSYLNWTWSKLIFYQLYEREGALSEQLGIYINFDAFELWCWGKLESPSDNKEIQPVNPKGNQSWIFIGRTDDAAAPILWPPDAKNRLFEKDPDAGKDSRQKEKRATKDKIARWHHWFSGHELGQTLGNNEGLGSLACHCPWGHEESVVTWQLNIWPWSIGNIASNISTLQEYSPWKKKN